MTEGVPLHSCLAACDGFVTCVALPVDGRYDVVLACMCVHHVCVCVQVCT